MATATDTTIDAPVLWGLADIAAYYGRSVRTAQRLVRRPGFPAPTPADPHRWVAQRVIDHSLQQPEPAEPEVLPARRRTGRVVRRTRTA